MYTDNRLVVWFAAATFLCKRLAKRMCRIFTNFMATKTERIPLTALLVD